jgi:hypothetical protein
VLHTEHTVALIGFSMVHAPQLFSSAPTAKSPISSWPMFVNSSAAPFCGSVYGAEVIGPSTGSDYLGLTALASCSAYLEMASMSSLALS